MSLFRIFGKSAAELFNDAVALEKQGMYNDAVQLLKKAIGNDQKFAPAYNLIAWIYAIHNYELEQALAYANKAVSLASTPKSHANYIDTRAEVLARLQRFDKAITQFGECLKISGGVDDQGINYSIGYRLGLCYLAKQDFNNAFSWISKALQRNPKNPIIYSTNGDICLALERYATAIDSYSMAINSSSGWDFSYPVYGRQSAPEQVNMFIATCLINMGVAFYNTEDYENCWNANKQSYDLCKLPNSIINLASLAAKNGDKASMRKLLEEGIPLIDVQNSGDIINFMITHPNMEENRDIVLDLLRNHNKITLNLYTQHKKAWQERKDAGYKSNASGLMMSGPIKQVVIGSSAFLEEGNMNSFNTNIGRDNNAPITNVGGDFTGNINFGSVSGRSDLLEELEKLKKQIEHAKNEKAINEDIAESAHQHVAKAIDEASKPSPTATTLVQHLNKARNFLEHVVSLATCVAQAIAAVKRIFL